MDWKTVLKKEQTRKLLYSCGLDVVVVAVGVALLSDRQNMVILIPALLLALWILPLFFSLKETVYFPVLWKTYLQSETEQWAYTLLCERRPPVVAIDPACGYETYCRVVCAQEGIDVQARITAAALGGFFAGRLDSRPPRERQYFQRAIDAALATYLRERQ